MNKLLLILFTLLSLTSYSQTESQETDYRLDPMRYFYKNKNYTESAQFAMELIRDKGGISESPYIIGYNSYKQLWKTIDNKVGLCDTLVYILDERMKYFGVTEKHLSNKGHYLYYANSDDLNSIVLDSLNSFYSSLENRDDANNLYYVKVISDLYDLDSMSIKEYDSLYNTIIFADTNSKRKVTADKYYSKRCAKNTEWLYLNLSKGDTVSGEKLLKIITDTDSLIDLYLTMYDLTKNDSKKESYKTNICYLYYEKGDYNNALKYKTNKTYVVIGNIYYNQYGKVKDFDKHLVMISAYLEYEKAGDTKNMNLCKQYFPTMEDIFVRGYSKGQMLYIGGLINKKVPLMIR